MQRSCRDRKRRKKDGLGKIITQWISFCKKDSYVSEVRSRNSRKDAFCSDYFNLAHLELELACYYKQEYGSHPGGRTLAAYWHRAAMDQKPQVNHPCLICSYAGGRAANEAVI